MSKKHADKRKSKKSISKEARSMEKHLEALNSVIWAYLESDCAKDPMWTIKRNLVQIKVPMLWHEYFADVCKHIGIKDKDSIDVLFCDLVKGNWDRLHCTEAESGMSFTEWAEKFYYDLVYFSDRWSVDRLCRAHWAFRHMMNLA